MAIVVELDTIDKEDLISPVLLKRDSTLQVKLFHEQLSIRGPEQAVGLDLYICENFTVPPYIWLLGFTGIKIKLPTGTYSRVALQSGVLLQRIDVAAGLIDQDYI